MPPKEEPEAQPGVTLWPLPLPQAAVTIKLRDPGPAPVGALDARREAFLPPGEVATRGGQRRVAGGAGDGAVMGKTLRPGDQAGGTAGSRLLFAFDFVAVPRLESEPQIRWCARAWIPCGGWAHRGACWEGVHLGNFHRQKQRGHPGDARRRGQPGISGSTRLTPPLPPRGEHPRSLGRAEGASVWVEAREAWEWEPRALLSLRTFLKGRKPCLDEPSLQGAWEN